MPRRLKHRCCRSDASGLYYKPRGVPMADLEDELLQLDEFEAMRLCDLDGLEQGEAGDKMRVSRGTILRLLETKKKKLIQAIVEKKSIQIGEFPSCCKNGKRCDEEICNVNSSDRQ